jgi:hypothetical protein
MDRQPHWAAKPGIPRLVIGVIGLWVLFFFLMGLALLVLMMLRSFDLFAPSRSAELAAMIIAIGGTYGIYKIAAHFARHDSGKVSPKGVWK